MKQLQSSVCQKILLTALGRCVEHKHFDSQSINWPLPNSAVTWSSQKKETEKKKRKKIRKEKRRREEGKELDRY